MRIGIDARLYRSSVAGIGRYSQNLIKNLLEIDKENEYVFFMTPEDKKEFDNWAIENSLKIKNCKFKIISVDIPHYSLAEQTKLPKIIYQEKPDLMFFLNVNFPVRYKGKFIITIHDLTLLFYPNAARKTNFLKQIVFSYVFKNACKNSTKIIAVSKNTKNDIIKTFRIAPEKIAVIYEAADDRSHPESIEGSVANATSRTSREILHLTVQDDTSIILYVGQFREHKNIKRLLEAYKILKKKTSTRLVLVGKVSDEVKKYIDNDHDLRDTLMPGFVSDEELAEWYKAADVFVFPSLYEGFGLPGLEAMAAGLPVVSSNKSSLPEIYQDAALYFDPLKPEGIADKIEMVLNNKEKQEELIKKGYENIKKYSWRKTAQETLELFKSV